MTTIDLEKLKEALERQYHNWALAEEKTDYFMPGRNDVAIIHKAACAYLQLQTENKDNP